ncbi:MAG: 30S ribosomal protein S8 [Gammaproteobacteria bacterium]
MSMQDPIADMLTQLRNAQLVGKPSVTLNASKVKLAILKVLKNEGYVADYELDAENSKTAHKVVTIHLKYYNEKPVMNLIKRVSKPGLRVYMGYNDLEKVQGGLGIAIVSTCKGVLSDREARQLRQGGEVICLVA